MKKGTSAAAMLAAAALLIITNAVPANAYWAWGPTWTNPSAARNLVVWDAAWDSNQQLHIESAALRWDNLAGSKLSTSGSQLTTSSSVFASARFNKSYPQPPGLLTHLLAQ